MRTEAILSRMERTQKKRKRKRLFWAVRRELLRAAVCLTGGAGLVLLAVPLMEMLMQSWGSRTAIEAGLCFFGILWLVKKIYRME